MLTAFLISVGVLCAINTLLALLMVLAEATIGNYGSVRVTLNGRRELTVDGGKPLLAALKEHNVFIPSACGGRGSCGLCKLTVENGGAPLSTELPWLSPEEQAAGVRLSCQLKVKRPLRITVPEEWLSVRQFAARVAALRDLTYDIKEVRLQLIDPPTIDFKAGQFIQFEVPPYALSDEPVYRAYSIASDPRQRGEIELEIRYVPNGICTTYVHRHLKEGDPVAFNGPYGNFYLRESDRDILFVAGGSGMAPIKAMLHQMAHEQNPRRTLYIFGARARRDLFLLEEMREFERRLPRFRFVPTLSAPAPNDGWTGATGLVTDVVEREVSEVSALEAYLCGSPLMIDACVNLLKKKGLPEERIFYDKFA